MTGLSGNEVKRLGKRLRDGSVTAADYDLLDAYRGEFDEVLLGTAHAINEVLNGQVTYIMAGRMKRTKSILRKLVRERNSGMDLSRMSDLVGLRVVTQTLCEQDRVLQLLKGALPLVREPYDYRARESGYRAIHIVSGSASHRVEIQLRTTAQHFWADESESLGEQAKEGTTTDPQARYLQNLFDFSRAVDGGAVTPATGSTEHEYCVAALDRLNLLLKRVTSHLRHGSGGSYVVVYQRLTNSLIRVDEFAGAERAEAISHYRQMSRSMDGDEYDILVLNSPSQEALAVTHPRYFPEANA
jgi:ppGpp synthetase/RelA/SpoT-type nucleotidyltranferase